MSNVMKDYLKMKVFGDSTTNADLKKWLMLNKEKQKIVSWLSDSENRGDGCYLLTHAVAKQKDLLNKTLAKYGEIVFRNSQNKLVCITGVQTILYNEKIDDFEIMLSCHFKNRTKRFSAWLSTMLQEGSAFKPNIAKTVAERLTEVNASIEHLKQQMQTFQNNVVAAYKAEVNSYEKLAQEAVTEKTLQARENEAYTFINSSRKRINNVKQLLTESEKEKLFNWLCDNIYSIKVYGLTGGRSGQLLQNNYSDNAGIHYRDPKYNNEGLRVSQDIISGELYFTDTINAPKDILNKICSNKHGHVLFKGDLNRRLCDTNLALYLLAEYGKYGFVAGKKNLHNFIDKEALLQNEFPKTPVQNTAD